MDEKYFLDQTSPDGILIPLLHNSFFVSRDMDVVITVLQGLGRNDILPLVELYSSKIDIGYPAFRAMQDVERFFALYIELHPAIDDLDLEAVCYIKQDICEVLGVEKIPYMLQFLGWMKDPVIVRFQVHLSLVDRVVEAVYDDSKSMENYARVEMNVRGAAFNYDLNVTKKRPNLSAKK